MTLYLRFAAVSDVGRVRRDNQDSGYVGPNLLVVADGVGGAARGDIASSATVEVLRKLDVPAGNDALSEIAATLHLAHDRLAEIVESHPDLDGTSTTVTAAIFDGTHLRVGHVGDSRAYLLRGGTIEQITSDHSLVQSLVDEGRITEEEARVHPHRNLILRAVDSVHEPEPDLFSIEVEAGDRLLFCSDGCSGVLDKPELSALLSTEMLQVAATRLVTSALDAGSSDNVTVVVAEVVDGEPGSAAAPVVVGAAAVSPHLQIARDATGNLSDDDVEDLQVAIDPETIRYAPQPPPRGGWVRRLALLVLVLAILGGAGFGAYQYSQTRYFVTADGTTVNVYRGVDFELPGIELNTFERDTGYQLDDLGEGYADKIRGTVSFTSLRKADAYVQDARCDKVVPKSTPTDPGPEDTAGLYRLGLKRVVPLGAKVGNLPPAPVREYPAWTGPIDVELLSCEVG